MRPRMTPESRSGEPLFLAVHAAFALPPSLACPLPLALATLLVHPYLGELPQRIKPQPPYP